jgi:secreted PhoX family phosphatase
MKHQEHSDACASAQTSRRQFARTIAAALVAAPLVSTTIIAQTPPAASKQAPAPPNPQPTPAPQAAPSPVAEGYAEVARLRFGDKLTADELARLKRDIEGNVRTAERLRAFKLKNADEPDFIFIA